MRGSILCVLTSLFACAQAEYFRPLENPSGGAPTQSAYDLIIGGRQYGEAKVWSAGAYSADVDGERRALVHVAVEVDNTSDTDLTLDPRELRLESIKLDGQTIADAPMFSTAGSVVIDPRAASRFDAYFELPTGTEPQDVDAFDVRWRVSASGRSYAQLTPFSELPSGATTYAPTTFFYPYYPAGYYYDWSFAYPYRRQHVDVRHHVPHDLGVGVQGRLPDRFPHDRITPHHDVRPHPATRPPSHHPVAPHHHHGHRGH